MSPFSLTAALLLFTTTRAYDPCVSLLYTPTHPHMLTQHRLQHRNHSDNALCPDVPFDAEPALQAAFHFCAPMAPRTCTPPHLTKHDTPQASPARPPPTPSTPPTSKPTASPRARPTSAGPPPAPTRTASPPSPPAPSATASTAGASTNNASSTHTHSHAHTYILTHYSSWARFVRRIQTIIAVNFSTSLRVRTCLDIGAGAGGFLAEMAHNGPSLSLSLYALIPQASPASASFATGAPSHT